MLLIGDVHGKYGRYKKIILDTENTVQVGDMGVGFFNLHGDELANPPFDRMVAGNHRFIRGNHDNPGVCRKHKQWIPDGHVENGVMFIGGAVSIDKDYRIEGCSWWPDEEVDDLERLYEVYCQTKPEMMVTHECPEVISYQLGNKPNGPWPSKTRKVFERMFTFHKPKAWVFGHWHTSFDRVELGTRFVCLAELEAKEITI